MHRFIMVALTSSVLVVSIAARTPNPQQILPSYVSAGACKACHADEYAAWSKTKHSMALSRLSAEDKESGKCIKCHVTGSPDMIAAEGSTPGHENVQCEACHGPGSAHLDAAKAGNAKQVKTVPITEATCTRCHSPESPHYKYFSFDGMKSLVHPKGSH
jgi:hypothetical protein